MSELNYTQKAIDAAGGPSAVARAFGKKSHTTVIDWGLANGGKGKAPSFLVPDLCRMGRGMFQPRQLRPDVFDESHDVPREF